MAGQTELEFDDLLFGVGDDSSALIQDANASRGEPRNAPARQISALTAGVKRMSLNYDDEDAPGIDVPPEVVGSGMPVGAAPPISLSKVNAFNAHIKGRWTDTQEDLPTSYPVRLGTSAPVTIPGSMRSWHRQQPAMQEVDEDTDDGNPRTGGKFVPPHLMVEQPAIQFSLNSRIAYKRAKLRARNEILTMTGFIEAPSPPRSQQRKNAGRLGTKAGALTQEFGAPALEKLDEF